jgi:hypothetical protein
LIICLEEDIATGEFVRRTHAVEEPSAQKRKLTEIEPAAFSPAPANGKCGLIALLEARCKLKGLPMPGPGQPLDPALYLSDNEGDSRSDDGVALVVEENENEKPSLPSGPSPKPGPSPKLEAKVVRPFVRALKMKPINDVNALLSQIISNQEKHNSKASPYEEAICIFNKDFATELDDIQVMHFIGLLSDNPSFVNQFLTFNSVQRGMFVKNKLALM